MDDDHGVDILVGVIVVLAQEELPAIEILARMPAELLDLGDDGGEKGEGVRINLIF